MRRVCFLAFGLFLVAFTAYAQAPAGLTTGTGIDNGLQSNNAPPQFDWPVVDSFPIPATIAGPTGLTWDGQNFWMTNYRSSTESAIFQLSPTGIINRFIPSPDMWPCGIAWDGSYLWVHDFIVGHSVYPTWMSMCKVDTVNGAVLDTLLVAYSYYSGGVAWDGQSLYYGKKSSSTAPSLCYIYKLDPVTGNHLDTIPLPLGDIYGVEYIDEHLWYSDPYHDQIYKIDLNGSFVDSSNSPGTYPRGVAFDGNYLCNIDYDTRYVYRMEIETAHLTVSLTPWRPPIQVRPGGFFWYLGELDNTTANPVTFDLWAEAILPNGVHYGPLMIYNNLTLGSMAHVERGVRVNVPQFAPPGNYQYYAAVGDYPGTVIDDDQFPFTILVGDPVSSNNQWLVEPLDDITMPVPTEFSLGNASPNPFNPTTNISFALPEAVKVKLVVYDVNGREVSRLADGWLPAGNYDFTWNAEEMPSGMYFAQLNADGVNRTVKLLLVK